MSTPFDPAPPANVAGVVTRFDSILSWARQHKSRLGYFAALYRGVTLRARSALSAGSFERPEAAERLVVLFAGRYFEALACHLGARATTRSWQGAFAAADRWTPTVSQHLLLGINAHINLDLGIAAARTLAETDLPKVDFERVNGLLLQMIDEVQTKLAEVWPLLRLFDWLAGRIDETLIGESLLHARAAAWDFAQTLRADGADETFLVAHQDQHVAEIGRHIINPGPALRLALGVVRLGELRDTVGIIDLLAAEAVPSLSSVEAAVVQRTPPA